MFSNNHFLFFTEWLKVFYGNIFHWRTIMQWTMKLLTIVFTTALLLYSTTTAVRQSKYIFMCFMFHLFCSLSTVLIKSKQSTRSWPIWFSWWTLEQRGALGMFLWTKLVLFLNFFLKLAQTIISTRTSILYNIWCVWTGNLISLKI